MTECITRIHYETNEEIYRKSWHTTWIHTGFRGSHEHFKQLIKWEWRKIFWVCFWHALEMVKQRDADVLRVSVYINCNDNKNKVSGSSYTHLCILRARMYTANLPTHTHARTNAHTHISESSYNCLW